VALAVLGTAVALAVGLWWVWPRTAITRENAERIREGMTLAEVEAILGGPARDEAGRRMFARVEYDRPLPASVSACEWIGKQDAVCVGFDADDRVVYVVAGRVTPPPERERGAFDRLRRQLGL
jgi:hypothetical protein